MPLAIRLFALAILSIIAIGPAWSAQNLPSSFSGLDRLHTQLDAMPRERVEDVFNALLDRVDRLSAAGHFARAQLYAQALKRAAGVLAMDAILPPPAGWRPVPLSYNTELQSYLQRPDHLALTRSYVDKKGNKVLVTAYFLVRPAARDVAQSEVHKEQQRGDFTEAKIVIGGFKGTLTVAGRDHCAKLIVLADRMVMTINGGCAASPQASAAALRKIISDFKLAGSIERTRAMLENESKAYDEARTSVGEYLGVDGHKGIGRGKAGLSGLLPHLRSFGQRKMFLAASRIADLLPEYLYGLAIAQVHQCYPTRFDWPEGVETKRPEYGSYTVGGETPDPKKLAMPHLGVGGGAYKDGEVVDLSIHILRDWPIDSSAIQPGLEIDPNDPTKATYGGRYAITAGRLVDTSFAPFFIRQLKFRCLDRLPPFYLPQ